MSETLGDHAIPAEVVTLWCLHLFIHSLFRLAY